MAASSEHIADRLLRMKRLIPVYLIHKLILVRVLGTNLVLWSLYTAFLAAFTASLLYGVARMLDLAPWLALSFALIVVLGEQSVLWWRLFHGEGIGLFCIALALSAMVWSTRRTQNSYALDLVVAHAVFLASLSKESFILLIPALVYARAALNRGNRRLVRKEAVKKGAWLNGLLIVLMGAELLIIRFGFNKTYFYYTGWTGFDAAKLLHIAGQFVTLQRGWILALPLIGLLALGLLSRKDSAIRAQLPNLLRPTFHIVTLGVLILVPQFLLYMSSGFTGPKNVNFERFLIPSTLGLSLLVVFPLASIQKTLDKAGSTSALLLRRVFTALCMAALAVYAATQLHVAMRAADNYAAHTAERAAFLAVVQDHASPGDALLVVFEWPQILHAENVMVILQEYLGLQNLLYLAGLPPGAEVPLSGEFGVLNRDREAIIARTLPVIVFPSVIMSEGPNAEKRFLEEMGPSFDAKCYRRVQNELNDIIYSALDRSGHSESAP